MYKSMIGEFIQDNYRIECSKSLSTQGNAQGKYQPHGSLGNDHAYIAEKLKSTQQSKFDVHKQNSADYLEGK